MPRGRHLRAFAPTRTSSRRLRAALLLAPVATVLAVGTGLALQGAGTPAVRPSSASSLSSLGSLDGATFPPGAVTSPQPSHERVLSTSRSTARVPLVKPVERRVPRAVGKLWTTADLKLRLAPAEKARSNGLVASGKQVSVTGHRQGAYAEVVVGRTARWVTAAYLSKKKVEKPQAKGLVDAACPGTESTENGLTSGAVRVYRAVCNAFPQITTYGGYDPHGEHASGKAIDIMTSDHALGDQIAAFLQANAGALNLYDIIWQQHIWTPVRASEGWRFMPDRGSTTANHYDHVHVSVN